MIEALTSSVASLKLVLWRKWKWKLLQSQLSINIDCGKNMLRKNDSNLFLFPIIISLLIRNSFPAHLLLLMCDICINVILVFWQDLGYLYQNYFDSIKIKSYFVCSLTSPFKALCFLNTCPILVIATLSLFKKHKIFLEAQSFSF